MRRFSSSTIASSGISAGEVSVKVSETNGVDYKLTISCNVYKEDNKLVTNELSLEIGITVKPTDLLHGLPNSDLVKVTAGAALVLAIAMIAAFVSGGAIMAGAGAAEKCVDLEISDWKEFTKKKEEAKKIDSA
ncbi:hypothetical protein, partial [Lactobacillus sp. PSON]|uniref:hypothetical protein n=1 Tax=Lactobacillus sp. PSON TaxID=3455454 RepID=UPI0040418158